MQRCYNSLHENEEERMRRGGRRSKLIAQIHKTDILETRRTSLGGVERHVEPPRICEEEEERGDEALAVQHGGARSAGQAVEE